MPIKKDKIFLLWQLSTHSCFGSGEIGISRGIRAADANRQQIVLTRRSWQNAANNDSAGFGGNVNTPGVIGTAPGDINPIAYALLNYPGLNGQKYPIPSVANQNSVVNQVFTNPGTAFGGNAALSQYGLQEAFPGGR